MFIVYQRYPQGSTAGFGGGIRPLHIWLLGEESLAAPPGER